MILPIALVAASSLVILLICLVILQRTNAASLQNGLQSIRQGFDGMQQTLMVAQKEFERGQDAKTAAMRAELSQELLANRKELQTGLLQLTQGLQTKLETNVKEGFRHFEKVQESLKQTELQLMNLNAIGKSVGDLNNLLKLPHLRGGFGEATLERILADLLPSSLYESQYQISPGSTERVDAVVKYPKQLLPIDSKFPREQILPLFEDDNPAQLEIARKNLIDVMRTMAKSIRDKYIRPDLGTADMALLFVPSETLYFEIIRNVKLVDELSKMKVFAVSPNTLAITLHAVNMARNYYEMSTGVEKTVSELRKTRQHFEHFERKFQDVGTALTKAQTSFNTATTHLSRYNSAVQRVTGEVEPEPEVSAALTEPSPPQIEN